MKNLIVTGSTRGIGLQIANYFIESGVHVIGCSRGPGVITSDKYEHHQVDLTDEKHVRSWARTIKLAHKSVDAVVCNVGLAKSKLLMPMVSSELLNSFIQTNFVAAYLTCREIGKIMVQQRYGRIINISSIMTGMHVAGTSAYSSTKAAVEEMTKVLAVEVAQTGVTCNAIACSTMLSESVRDLGEEWMSKMLAAQTMKRPLEVAELCSVIRYLGGRESSAVTGQVINLCMVV